MFTYETWEEPTITFQEDDSYKGALSVLKWAYGHYGRSARLRMQLWY